MPSVDEIDIRSLLQTLWRRKMVVVVTAFLIVTMTALVVFQLTPRFTASANVMLETRQSNVVDIESVMSGISADMAVVLSEVEIIRSSSLIRRVVDRLNLVNDPEFNAALRIEPWYSDFLKLETYASEELLQTLGLSKPEEPLTPDEAKEKQKTEVIKAVREQLGVVPIRRSLVISISFVSDDPGKAALIANTVADNYIVDQLEAKYEATRRATSWLNDRLGVLRSSVKESEDAVESFRAQMANQIGQTSELTTQQISELNSQLILAQAQRAEAGARLSQIQELLSSAGDLNSAAEVLNSPLIQRLRDQEAEVIRNVSELEVRYGDRHPRMIKAKAELRDLRLGIEREVRKIAQSLRNEMQVAEVRETTLESNLQRLEVKSGRQDRAQIQLRELEREAAANRLLYENFLSRFKETSEQEELQQADARLISRADVPISPTFPRKKLILLVAAIGSVLLGVVLVFLIERFDNTFRNPDQLEQQTGVPAIGMIPLISSVFGRRKVAKYLLEKPTSAVGEAVRSLRTSLLLSNVDNPPRIIGTTSTVPAEGKSTLSIWLAQTAAMSGQKVLLIDGDLRRPTLHKVLEINNEKGLVELLSDEVTFASAVKPVSDGSNGYHLIPGKHVSANSINLLSSENMTKMLDLAKQHFDFIIIDCPPTLAVSDTKIIAQLVDKMLYVVKWDETPKPLVQTGLKAALSAKMDIAGVVLTQVNLRKHSRYGYGDYGYYYGKYGDYYSN